MAKMTKAVSIDPEDVAWFDQNHIGISQFLRNALQRYKQELKEREQNKEAEFFKREADHQEAKAGLMIRYIQGKGLFDDYRLWKKDLEEIKEKATEDETS